MNYVELDTAVSHYTSSADAHADDSTPHGNDALPLSPLSNTRLPQRMTSTMLYLPRAQLVVPLCLVRGWQLRKRRPRRSVGDVLLGRARAPTTYDLELRISDPRDFMVGERSYCYARAFASVDAGLAYIHRVLTVDV